MSRFKLVAMFQKDIQKHYHQQDSVESCYPLAQQARSINVDPILATATNLNRYGNSHNGDNKQVLHNFLL